MLQVMRVAALVSCACITVVHFLSVVCVASSNDEFAITRTIYVDSRPSKVSNSSLLARSTTDEKRNRHANNSSKQFEPAYLGQSSAKQHLFNETSSKQFRPIRDNFGYNEDDTIRRDFLRPTDELNSSFLALFDELWRIKNNSVSALIRLKYFTRFGPLRQPSSTPSPYGSYLAPQRSTSKPSFPHTGTRPSEAPPYERWNKTGGFKHETLNNRPLDNGSGADDASDLEQTTEANLTQVASRQPNNQQHKQQDSASIIIISSAKHSQPFSAVGAKIQAWLTQLNISLNNLLLGLTKPLANKLTARPSLQLRHQQQQIRAEPLPGPLGRQTTSSLTNINAPDDDESARWRPDGSRTNRSERAASEASSHNKVLRGVKAKRSSPEPLLEAASSRMDEREDRSTTRTGRSNGATDAPLAAPACIELDFNQRNKCASIELQVSANLNNSFPGTLRAIEDNCKQLAFLLANCWPRQQQQISASLASWNESLLSITDFPLPATTTAVQQKHQQFNSPSLQQQRHDLTPAPSCGVEPRIPELVLDRISWMWLNLCMDKRFRSDYVDNLKCLSLWTQERAQGACTSEFRRMQANLVPLSSAASSGSHHQGGRQMSQPSTLVSQASPGSSGTMQSGVAFKPERAVAATAELNKGVDRELESKVLCCMFDQFLRCVHKHALRDCGRAGAQFVVTFMSRIGTDDMKYLCNNEPKPMNTPIFQGNSRVRPSNSGRGKNNFTLVDKGPFIESNYCADPRISAAFQIPQISNDRGPSGNGLFHKPANFKNSTRTGTHNNYDQTFFGGDALANESNNSASTSRISSGLRTLFVFIPWALAISFNAILVKMILPGSFCIVVNC